MDYLYGDDNFKDLIGDGTFVHHDGLDRPLSAKPCIRQPGKIVGAPLITPEQLIPREQWDDLIAQGDADDSWLESLVRNKVPCEDQKTLSYCHAFSTTEAAKVAYAKAGESIPLLAATSIGGPITGWMDTGADIADDWAQLRDHGACTLDYLPNEWDLNYRSWKPGWQQNAMLHREFQGLDLRLTDLSFDAMATACLRRMPVVVAFSWWSHAITGGYRLKKLGADQYALLYRNNWGASYKDNGFLWLTGSKAIPDWGAIANLGMTGQS